MPICRLLKIDQRPCSSIFTPIIIGMDRAGGYEPTMQKRTGEKGFTLLEVMVALAVMAIAFTLVLQLFSTNLRSIAGSADMTSAVARGDARIREIASDGSLTEKAWREITEDGYHIDVSIQEILKERTDNLPVKLMEVSLTTYWVDGRKEKSYKLKTVKMVDKTPSVEKPSTL